MKVYQNMMLVFSVTVLCGVSASRQRTGAKATATSGEGASSRDPMDALEYVRTRAHEEQHDNDHLSHELAEAAQNGRDARESLNRASVKLQEIPRLKNRMNSLLAEKASMLSQLSQEWKREKTIAAQLHNVSRVSLKRARVLGRARDLLSKAVRENSALSRQLANMTSVKAKLSKAVGVVQHDNDALHLTDHGKDLALDRSRRFISQMRSSLKTLQVAEAQDRAKQAAASLNKQQALTREVEAESILKKTNTEKHASQVEVAALRAKVDREAQANANFAASLAVHKVSMTTLGQEQKSEQSQDADVQAHEHHLREEILALHKKLSEADSLRQQAQNQAASAKDDLFTAQSQVQEVKGTVPWLQAKVAEEEAAVTNATAATEEARSERDETRATLAASRQKIVHLEQEYSVIVKMVGTSVAKGQAADTVGDGEVVANLTTMVHGAVADVPAEQAADTQDGDTPAMSASPADGDESTTLPSLPSPSPSSAHKNLLKLGSTPAKEAPEIEDGRTLGLEKDSTDLEDLLSGIVPDPEPSS